MCTYPLHWDSMTDRQIGRVRFVKRLSTETIQGNCNLPKVPRLLRLQGQGLARFAS